MERHIDIIGDIDLDITDALMQSWLWEPFFYK